MCGCACTCGHARCVSGALSIDWTIGVGHQMCAVVYTQREQTCAVCRTDDICVCGGARARALQGLQHVLELLLHRVRARVDRGRLRAVGDVLRRVGRPGRGRYIYLFVLSLLFDARSACGSGRSCRPDPPSSPRLATTIVANMRRAFFRLQRTNQLVYARPRRSRRSSSSTARSSSRRSSSRGPSGSACGAT